MSPRPGATTPTGAWVAGLDAVNERPNWVDLSQSVVATRPAGIGARPSPLYAPAEVPCPHPDREPAPSGGSTVRIWDGFGKNLGRIRSFDTTGSRMFAVDRLWVEADVVDLCPPRLARIKDYNERSRRAGYRRDAHRARTGESLHRCAVSTVILVPWLLSRRTAGRQGRSAKTV